MSCSFPLFCLNASVWQLPHFVTRKALMRYSIWTHTNTIRSPFLFVHQAVQHNSYSSQTKTTKVTDLMVKCPTKTKTNHHNYDLNSGFLLQWFCLLTSGVVNNAQSSVNYSLNCLINFNSPSVLSICSEFTVYNSHSQC